MNIKQISLMVMATIGCSNLVQAKGMPQRNEPKKSIFSFFRKNNQNYISFRSVGCFRTDDADVKVLSASYLRDIQKSYPFAINENTCFDIAYIFHEKSAGYNCFLVPHQVVKNLKNGQTVPVKIGKQQIDVIVKR